MGFKKLLLQDALAPRQKVPEGATPDDIWNLSGTYSAASVCKGLGLSIKSVKNSTEFRQDPARIGFEKDETRWVVNMQVFKGFKSIFNSERFRLDKGYSSLPRGTTLDSFLDGDLDTEVHYLLSSALRLLKINRDDLLGWMKNKGYKPEACGIYTGKGSKETFLYEPFVIAVFAFKRGLTLDEAEAMLVDAGED